MSSRIASLFIPSPSPPRSLSLSRGPSPLSISQPEPSPTRSLHSSIYTGNSDSEEDSDDDGDDGIEWGHPLQRMIRPGEGVTHYLSFCDDGDEMGREEDYSEEERSEAEESDSSSVCWDDVNFEEIIDELIEKDSFHLPGFGDPKYIIVDSPEPLTPNSDSTLAPSSSLMILPLPLLSHQVLLLLQFNQPEYRDDPWNPVPHVVAAVERRLPKRVVKGHFSRNFEGMNETTNYDKEQDQCDDGDCEDGDPDHPRVGSEEGEDYVFLCMHHLHDYDEPPLKSVANYVDFIRQALEGLTFLHEHQIACLPPFSVVESQSSNDHIYHLTSTEDETECTDGGKAPSKPLNFMVDLSSSDSTGFDRSRFPVHYYFTEYSQAICTDNSSSFGRSMLSPKKSDPAVFKEDVKQWGNMIRVLIKDIPNLAQKFKPLVQSMSSGGFSADDARKLFEGLCWSLDGASWDEGVVQNSQSSPSLVSPLRSGARVPLVLAYRSVERVNARSRSRPQSPSSRSASPLAQVIVPAPADNGRNNINPQFTAA